MHTGSTTLCTLSWVHAHRHSSIRWKQSIARGCRKARTVRWVFPDHPLFLFVLSCLSAECVWKIWRLGAQYSSCLQLHGWNIRVLIKYLQFNKVQCTRTLDDVRRRIPFFSPFLPPTHPSTHANSLSHVWHAPWPSRWVSDRHFQPSSTELASLLLS